MPDTCRPRWTPVRPEPPVQAPRWRFVNGLERCGKGFDVFIRYIAGRAADLMDDASLDFCPGICRGDGFGKAGQSVYRYDQYVLYTSAFQPVQHAQPVFRAFRGTDPDAQDILFPFKVGANTNVYGFLDNDPVFPHLVMDGVQHDHGIYAFQRPVLPFPDHRQNLVRDLGYPGRVYLDPVHLLHGSFDIPCRCSL